MTGRPVPTTYAALRHEIVQVFLEGAVDLGGLEDARARLAVVSAKEQTGEGERYRFAADRTSRPRLYTYQARVGEVIDGDTLWAEIDCGFGVWVEQKLRLRGVDAPELSRPAGGQVRRFVDETLSQVEFVLLSTSRADKCDRYLADVFYRAGEQELQGVLREGSCLNQKLLDQGLVPPFRE